MLCSKPPNRHHYLLEPAHEYSQGEPSSSAIRDQRGCTQKPPGGKGGDGPRTRHTFALDNWLNEPRRAGPFNMVASARAPHWHHVESTSLASGLSWDNASSLGYLHNSAVPKNGDKTTADLLTCTFSYP
ncbi:hypothetical protein V8C37DRAFT_372640 [Trichoderma ceciliae]